MKTSNNKSKQDDELKPQEKQLNVSVESKAVKKKSKSKKPKANKAVKNAVAVEAKETTKTLTAADIAKIEKKNAKKQMVKLRKQARKLAGETKETESKSETKADKTSNSSTDVAEKKTDKKQGKKQTAKPKRSANDKNKDIEKREKDPAAPAATVFVGNLPTNTKRVQIVRLFQPYGTVQSIRFRTAGGMKLFKHKQRKAAGSLNAYVVLETPEIAQKALALNGTEFKKCHLRITPAAKVRAGAGAGTDGNDQSTNDAATKRTIFVGNLSYSANEQKLREIFSSCGEIDYIRCLHDGKNGCKGVAYVCFKKPDAVGLALELNETVLDERPIHVERYSVKKQGAKQARDSAAARTAGSQTKSKNKQNSAGAKKRLDKKKLKENGKHAGPTKVAGNKKKSEYRGVKVDGIKKNKKPKKKTNNQMNALAKKIAPKTKT
ncbi:hypothetical protein ACLKA6_016519 [Drosophila palustris]